MTHAVVHFEIAGPDAAKLREFYSSLFGWTVDANNPMNYGMVFKMPGGIGGGIAGSDDGTAGVRFYVTCGDDVGGTLRKAESLGATPLFGPDTVPGGGPTIAAFADRDGNFIGLVNGTPDEEPPMTGGGSAVTWFEIGCSDAAASQQFFRDLFGWEIDADNEMQYGMVSPLGTGIGGGISPTERGAYTTVYVDAEDLDGTLAKAGELGGQTVMPPTDVPGGPRIAMFADPAGNVVGLAKPMGAA